MINLKDRLFRHVDEGNIPAATPVSCITPGWLLKTNNETYLVFDKKICESKISPISKLPVWSRKIEGPPKKELTANGKEENVYVTMRNSHDRNIYLSILCSNDGAYELKRILIPESSMINKHFVKLVVDHEGNGWQT